MPLPADVSLSLITDSYVGFDGEPAEGEIRFYPTVSELRTASGVTILRENTPLVGTLVAGALSIAVPATDDPDLTPAGWGYRVVEKFTNRDNERPYTILAPFPGVVLSEVAPVTVIEPVASVVRSVNNIGPNAAGNVTIPIPDSPDDIGAQAAGDYATNPALSALDTRVQAVEARPIVDSPDDIGAQPAGDYATNTALTNGLAGKANTAHTHAQADVTGLVSALNSKIDEGALLFNVKDYGAVGDGVTDDSVSIRSALGAASVAGGTVYFPRGEYLVSVGSNGVALHVTGKGVTLLGESMDASIIKLANSQGDYKAIVGDNTVNGTTDLSGLTVRNLTFDQNSSGNVIVSITNLMSGQPRYIIRAFVGRRFTVANCRFTDANNVNTVSFNGGSAMSEVVIRDNIFDDHGANSPDHDHSAIYTNGDGSIIQGNIFVGVAVSARTAIEVHGPRQIVTHNVVRDFFVGVNLAGISPLASNGCVVSENTMEGVGVGVCLWSRTSGINTTNGLRDSVVRGNDIIIDMDKWSSIVAFKSGILFDPGANLPFKNILIDGNIIRFKTFVTVPTATDKSSTGVTFVRNDGVIPVASVDERIVVSNNQVEGAPGSGMIFHTKCVTSGLHIRDNEIINPATGNSPNFASEYKCGIMVQGISGVTEYRDLHMIRNNVSDYRASTVTTFGVHTAFVTGAHPGPVHQTHVFATGTTFPAVSANNDLGTTAFVAY